MKKIILVAILFLATSISLYASVNGQTSKGPLARLGTVEARGFANLLGSPAEFCTTAQREVPLHPRLWPLTYFPRFFGNLALRVTSGVADILFYPFVVPFTDDISPWTEPFGFPDYPWQKE